MAAITPTCEFGWKAKDFDLEGVDGKRYTLDDVKGEKGTLVIFMCNHCPYVKAVIHEMIRDVRDLAREGVGAIAIMSNDTETYPADSFENMAVWSDELGFPFPYVIDPSQQVARAYDAVCTPDFFGFNAELELQYRGRIAELRQLDPVLGGRRELFEAMREIAATGKGPHEQTPSMGCSIKWRA
jgi:peroxiredoxin